ncbi:type II toxin-antitoxin system HicB family antitoxin [bacterium]|nr:type II toxin-antitoxin system HicB family antitoxin [FCB group bacterium]MBL7191811.1 type II toxin-antitoxin system HicB family antitoxin [bacterium]
MTERKYTVIFEPAEEGGWLAHVPALNGLTTEGDTLEEAQAMVKDAVKGYIESLQKDNLPLPDDIIESDTGNLSIDRMAFSL